MASPYRYSVDRAEAALPYCETDHQRQVVLQLRQTPNIAEAAAELGMKRSSVSAVFRRVERIAELGGQSGGLRPRLEELPASDVPVEELLEAKRRRFELKAAAKEANRWRRVLLDTTDPVGLLTFGDPHIDDDGCDLPVLEADMALVRETEGLFCGNIGDTLNNWVGRLMRLHANQSTTARDAWRMAEWFLEELEPWWVFWLLGNHDVWNEGAEIFERMGSRLVRMDDWQCRLRLVFGNDRECRIHAAHDFPGNSIRDKNWGEKRADAESFGDAQIYLAGHRHTTAIQRVPCAIRRKPIIYARASGYKALDSYADNLGYSWQGEGESVTLVFDPLAKTEAEFVHAFTCTREAVDFLRYKRCVAEGWTFQGRGRPVRVPPKK